MEKIEYQKKLRELLGKIVLVYVDRQVGYNHITKDDLKIALEKKDRKYAPKLASPNGLYLVRIKYENE